MSFLKAWGMHVGKLYLGLTSADMKMEFRSVKFRLPGHLFTVFMLCHALRLQYLKCQITEHLLDMLVLLYVAKYNQ